jgi:hypothetical protein
MWVIICNVGYINVMINKYDLIDYRNVMLVVINIYQVIDVYNNYN